MSYDTVKATLAAVPYRVTLTDHRHVWFGDVPATSGGGDSGPDPHAQLLAAFGTCTAITVKMYADRKSWPLSGMDVDVSYEPESTATRTRIRCKVALSGPLTDEQRARLMQIAAACPIHRLLTGEISIATELAT